MKKCQRLECLAAGLAGFSVAGVIGWRGLAFLWESIKERDKRLYTADAKIELLKMWLRASGGSALERYLRDRGASRIAIYGYSDIGDLIYRCLKNSSIEVAYAIDIHGKDKPSWVNILTLQDDLPPVDMVILAPVGKLDGVREALSEKLSCEIVDISLLVHYL